MSTDSTDAIDSIDLVRPDELVPEPWKNGAGTTVELAAGPRVNGIALWRFSIATLDDVTTRFSTFAGTNRVFTGIGEAGVLLAFPAGSSRVNPFRPLPFSGSADVVCTPDSATKALNVMVDAVRASASVFVHELSSGPVVTEVQAVTLVLVCSGTASTGSSIATAGCCLLIEGSRAEVSGDARVLVARVTPSGPSSSPRADGRVT